MILLVIKTNNDVNVPFCGNLEYGISYVGNYDALYYKKNCVPLQDFSSGNDVLDEILHKELHRHKECKSFLFYQKDDPVPIAFCSMCCSSISIEEEIEGAGIVELMHPAIEFRYFAVRKDLQNKPLDNSSEKISSYIFTQCMYYAYSVATDLMSAEYFVLHAHNSKRVRKFYDKHLFSELPSGVQIATDAYFENHIPAFLPISELEME